jgi:predicted DsbA family dithiol-disulfide isomerase
LKTVHIDFVSDIACPWCAIGLASLEKALSVVGDEVNVEIHFQPFELNAHMPLGGQDVIEYLTEKYGTTVSQVKANQENIRKRAAEMGFLFHPEGRKRVYNTFHAHRLLHWALAEHGLEAQYKLKKELLATYFTLAVSVDDPKNLLDAVQRAGLSIERARAILESDEFAQAVRDQKKKYTELGINSVPAIILDNKYMIQGAQAPELFASAMRDCAQESES